MVILAEFCKCLFCFKIIFLCNVAAVTERVSQVEVRAVFIKCEPDERQTFSLDNEVSRFEREELYKHSALRDCSKKIAVTVKIASPPDMNSDDEFIPIEHVLQGSRRVRLLNPYVMRLRRDQPLQAYKLKRIDTVSGILEYTDDNFKRFQRSSDISTSPPNMVYLNSSYSSLNGLEYSTDTTQKHIVKNYDFLPTYSSISNKSKCSNKRNKRNEQNILIESEPTEIITEKSQGHRIREEVSGLDKLKHPYIEKHVQLEENKVTYMDSGTNVSPANQATVILDLGRRYKDEYKIDKTKLSNMNKLDWQDVQGDVIRRKKNSRNPKFEQPLIVYEIDNPDVWSTVHVQMFEKLSTPEGKTMWNDLSKGESISVSSLSPEWSDQDLNVRYRANWIPKENFSLSMTHMCLLKSQDKYDTKDALEENSNSVKYGNYIVVPKEDIVTLDNEKTVIKSHLVNYSDDQEPANQFRRVMVRMSRALVDRKENKLNITAYKGDIYLTLPYGGTHQAQIDLEARADENQLVNVGSTGRIMTIVSDNTRRTRTIVNVQIMNTGLMAARFSIKPRDCGPELQSSDDQGGTDNANNNVMLLPPRHTRNVRLVLPIEIPSDSTRCSVLLVGDEGNLVAVRDVTIKKGDRCYCVWHCECVCLSDDPKLICTEMPDSRQVAAGLSLRERTRHARSICYHDAPSLNVIVTFFGVLIVLFILGFIKAVLGLIFRYIGSWGIDSIVETPRHLSRYYEQSLQDIPVVYDDEGWPIHPVTKNRTVRLISRSMEFLINLVFFIVLPCRLVHDCIKLICNQIWFNRKNTKKTDRDQMRNPCDIRSRGSEDMQEPVQLLRRRRRRNRLRRWMTNEADDLTSFLWKKSLVVDQLSNNTSMRPLILEDNGKNYKKPPNSDDDDTEFVLTQIKKSLESLAKSQKNQSGGGKQQQPPLKKSNNAKGPGT